MLAAQAAACATSRSPPTASCSPSRSTRCTAAGLRRITVSLDTLRPDRFRALTRFDELDARARRASPRRRRVFGRLQDRHGRHPRRQRRRAGRPDRVRQARSNAEVRFIEYMDVGGATHWSPARVVSRAEMLDALAAHYGADRADRRARSSAPADRFALPDGTTFGIISSTTEPFCRELRPQPAHGRRHVVPVPLRDARHRPARAAAAAARRLTNCARSITRGWQRARPTAAPRSAWRSAIAARSCRSAIAQAGSAPRDAHARRVSLGVLCNRMCPLCAAA